MSTLLTDEKSSIMERRGGICLIDALDVDLGPGSHQRRSYELSVNGLCGLRESDDGNGLEEGV